MPGSITFRSGGQIKREGCPRTAGSRAPWLLWLADCREGGMDGGMDGGMEGWTSALEQGA